MKSLDITRINPFSPTRLDNTDEIDFEKCMQDMKEIGGTYLRASAVMMAITLLLLPIFIYMTVKVSRIVWRNEKVVPLMLIMLCITLFSMVLFYSFMIASMKYPE